jgi:hypothetical protein
MRGRHASAFLLLALGGYSACGQAGQGTAPTCEPDKPISCSFCDGGIGTRKCNPDGTASDTCLCSIGFGGSDTGGVGGLGGSPAGGTAGLATSGGGGSGGASGAGGAGGTGGDAATCVASPEVCNGLDDDCNGVVDDDASDASTWYRDQDGDGFGVSSTTLNACTQPAGYADKPGDCRDDDPAFHPGAPETDCNDPNDYNCDGSTAFSDADGDGWGACVDCDDTNPDIHPGAPEICDGKDDDCNGLADYPGGETNCDAGP